jgi:hypothetical protein
LTSEENGSILHQMDSKSAKIPSRLHIYASLHTKNEEFPT